MITATMGHQPSNFARWTLSAGVIAALTGAAIILTFVVATYLERDVIRIRGVVISFVLIGLALVVKSEAHAYVPEPRSRR